MCEGRGKSGHSPDCDFYEAPKITINKPQHVKRKFRLDKCGRCGIKLNSKFAGEIKDGYCEDCYGKKTIYIKEQKDYQEDEFDKFIEQILTIKKIDK